MELQELQREIAPLSQSAEKLLATANEPINDPVAYEGAVATLKTIKGRYNELDEREKAITRPINDSLKLVRDLFRKPKDILQQAESALKRGILAYDAEQERKRREAQRQAEEAAERERQRLANLEEKAVARGDTAKAEQFQERAAAVVAPIVQVDAPKVAGVATRTDYDFEVVDAAKLPREYLVPDEKKLRKVVKALGNDCNIPGIRVIERKVLAARSA